jgi:hypothetical protein
MNNNKITFGKYKDKHFDDILKNDKSYCSYILNQKNCTGNFKQFQLYIKNNINYLYNIDDIYKKDINCSKLCNYLENINDIKLTLNEKNILTNKICNITNKIQEPALFGVFVDYLIRYEITKQQNNINKFHDNRADNIIYSIDIHNDIHSIIFDEFIIYENLDIDILDDLTIDFFRNLNISGVFFSYKYYLISEYYDNILTYIYTLQLNNKNEILSKLYQIKSIVNSYNKCTSINAELTDILNVSICHFISFNEHKYYDYINYNKILLTDTEYNDIIIYIKNKIYKKTNIICNPILGSKNLMISADGDLIIDNELIDFKTSVNYIGDNNNDYIQLIIYSLLYYIQTGVYISNITICNILTGYEKTINIENYDYKPLINILLNRVDNTLNCNVDDIKYKKECETNCLKACVNPLLNKHHNKCKNIGKCIL